MTRYPYVAQVDMRDCGVAVLAMVLKHFGTVVSLASLRALAKTTNQGTTALRLKEIDREFVEYLRKDFDYAKAQSLQKAIKQTAQLILNTIILWYGANLVMDGKVTIGQLITFNALITYFINPLENIINLQTKLQSAKVAKTRLQ